MLSTNDVYKEFLLRGYEYGLGELKGEAGSL
jgi:hypothetical protein